MVAQTYDHRLRKLREAIVNHLPYTSGTVSVQENELLVYYGKKGHALGYVSTKAQAPFTFFLCSTVLWRHANMFNTVA